jgi:uncharacterized membrane protein YccF (DUF307 family)
MEMVLMTATSLFLIGMILLLTLYLIPFTRAGNALTNIGFIKLGGKIREALSKSEEMTLDRETLKLASQSFLFSQRNTKAMTEERKSASSLGGDTND